MADQVVKQSDDLTAQKLAMWQEKLAKLEEELQALIQRKADAAADGDLSENAAYKMAAEDADTWRARIEDVKRIIAKLEDGSSPEKK